MLTSLGHGLSWLALFCFLVIGYGACIGFLGFVVISIVGGAIDLWRWWDARRHES